MPRLKKNEMVVEFDVPRVFTDAELSEFHQKRKRFYQEHTLTDGKIVSIFNQDEFGVAYGALIKKKVGGADLYMIPHKTEVNGNVIEGEKRYAEMVNLLEQHDKWFRKQDSYTESLQETANEIPF